MSGKIAHVGERRGRGKLDHLEDLDVDGRIILKCVLKKWDVRAWIGWICLRIGTGGFLL
jgi:hypothetical protein